MTKHFLQILLFFFTKYCLRENAWKFLPAKWLNVENWDSGRWSTAVLWLGKASPAPSTSSPLPFRGDLKPDFFFFNLNSLTKVRVWNFLRRLSWCLWAPPPWAMWPHVPLPCRAAGRCVVPCPAPGSFQPMSGLAPSPPLLCMAVCASFHCFSQASHLSLAESKCSVALNKWVKHIIFSKTFYGAHQPVGVDQELLAGWQLFIRSGFLASDLFFPHPTPHILALWGTDF